MEQGKLQSSGFLAMLEQSVAPLTIFVAPPPRAETARLEWRILIQVLAMQINEMKREHGSELTLWIDRIIETLSRVNAKAQLFKPQVIPADIVPPMVDYLAQDATGNWCDALTHELTQLFLNVPNADTLKIELFPTDGEPTRNTGSPSSYNLPAVLKADNISIPQEQTR